MEPGNCKRVLLLSFLTLCCSVFSYGKAVPGEPEKHFRGYEYTYSFKNDKHEIRPLYEAKNGMVPPTKKSKLIYKPLNPKRTNGPPIFVPQTEHSTKDINKMLNNYYNSKHLNSVHQEMSRDFSTHLEDFVLAWTTESSEGYNKDGYDYFERPVITSSMKKSDITQDESHCTDCNVHISKNDLYRHRLNPTIEYMELPKHVNDQDLLRKKKIKSINDQSLGLTENSESIVQGESANKGFKYGKVEVVNKKKNDGKDFSVNTEEYYPPLSLETIKKNSVAVVKRTKKTKVKHSSLNDHENRQFSSVIKVKHKKQGIIATQTGKDYADNSGYGKETPPTLEKVKTISKEQKVNSEEKDKHESSSHGTPIVYTEERVQKVKPKCAQLQLQTNDYGTDCSGNENSHDSAKTSEINEHPTIVKTISKHSVKSSVKYNEYKPKSPDNENKKGEFSSGGRSTSNEKLEVIESNTKLHDSLTNMLDDEYIGDVLDEENINLNGLKFRNMESSGSEIEISRKGIDGNSPGIPEILEVDDRLRSLSLLNSNILSLVFNPNAKGHNLKKCVTRNNETGYCMYVQNCRVPNIATSLEQLLNNACAVDEVFIGVCCPEFPVETVKVHWGQSENASIDKETDDLDHESEDCGTRSNEASKAQSWPWKAPLVSMSNGKIFCGGVTIGEEYILTAAHCTTKIPKNQILVRLGQHDESSGEDFAVIEIKRHAQYNPRTMQNDIALLKLGRRVLFDKYTNRICLPQHVEIHSGEKALFLGWKGVLGENPKKSEFLEVLSTEECQLKLNTDVSQSVLCTEARNEEERTCNADSGAPLVIEGEDKYEVIGVLSWNRNDCDPRFPSTFSRVSSYMGWIRKHAV